MPANKKATRDSILKAKKGATKVVPIEEFGDVTIKAISSRQRAEIEQSIVTARDSGAPLFQGARIDALIMAVIDPETGEPMLTEEDRKTLEEMDNRPIEELYDEIAEMNGFGKSANRKAQVEDAAKNSGRTRRS